MTRTVDLPPTIPNMAQIVLKLAIWSLFGAIATILASATANGLAVESRPAPFTPIPSATPHSDSAKPSTTTDRYLSTSAGADGFSTSVASIASMARILRRPDRKPRTTHAVASWSATAGARSAEPFHVPSCVAEVRARKRTNVAAARQRQRGLGSDWPCV